LAASRVALNKLRPERERDPAQPISLSRTHTAHVGPPQMTKNTAAKTYKVLVQVKVQKAGKRRRLSPAQ